MDDQKITLQSLLKSKAKLIADRNERFAIINEEVSHLKHDLRLKMNEMNEMKEKIRTTREEKDRTGE